MSFLGNVLWFIFGGLFSGLSWILSGIIWCITIVGIPYGRQCFKFASMSFAPFGKEIEYGGGFPSLLANVIWIIFFGIPMALENLIFGYNHSRNTIRLAVFQNCKTFSCTIWSKDSLSQKQCYLETKALI